MASETKTETMLTNPKRKIALLAMFFILFWTPVIVFSKLAGEVLEKEPIGLDDSILFWIHAHATPLYDYIFLVITSVGNGEVIGLVTLLLAAWLLYKRQRLSAFIVFFSVAGAAAANVILKLLFQRERPAFWQSLITETSYSFPSGHALLSSALILGIIAITWNTRARWPAIIVGSIVVVLIGISRLYMGVHYPSDIVAGWSIGLVWVLIVYSIGHGLSYRRRSKSVAAYRSS